MLQLANAHGHENSVAEAGVEASAVDIDNQVALRDLALDHIDQGVCVFDSQKRLLLFNRRFAEMYRIAPERLATGMSLSSIIDLRYAAGTGSNMMPDQYTTWRTQICDGDRVNDTEVTLRDGRVLLIHHEPLNAGGWVATHFDITERRRAEARVRHMAHHDALTGLPNRVQLTGRLEEMLVSLREGTPLIPSTADRRSGAWTFALMFVDLDHFKDVNDTLGHAAGDQLLRLVSQRIAKVTQEGDLVARLGGDEFAIVTEACNGTDRVTVLARRIIEEVGAPFQLDQLEAHVGASVGIAMCSSRDGALAPELLMRQADMALYRAKEEGRGRFRFFSAHMFEVLEQRTSLERDLRRAIAQEEIVAAYQPQLAATTGRVVGAEALARWTHPTRGVISPAEFIPAAERAGLIGEVGEQILLSACARAAAWGIRVAVNLSPEQVKRPGLPDVVRDVLARTGLPPHLLELEITETVLLHDTAATRQRLQQIRSIGVGLALDDFGTGYCSMSYLDRYPFTKLKIDRSFVAKLANGPTAAIVQAVITLGHTLAMRVNAEGVETQEQFDLLRAMGCDEIQGFLLGRPESAEQFARRLARQGPGASDVHETWEREETDAVTGSDGGDGVRELGQAV